MTISQDSLIEIVKRFFGLGLFGLSIFYIFHISSSQLKDLNQFSKIFTPLGLLLCALVPILFGLVAFYFRIERANRLGSRFGYYRNQKEIVLHAEILNNCLPFRSGDGYRLFSISKDLGIGKSAKLLIIEKFLDIFVVLAIAFCSLFGWFAFQAESWVVFICTTVLAMAITVYVLQLLRGSAKFSKLLPASDVIRHSFGIWVPEWLLFLSVSFYWFDSLHPGLVGLFFVGVIAGQFLPGVPGGIGVVQGAHLLLLNDQANVTMILIVSVIGLSTIIIWPLVFMVIHKSGVWKTILSGCRLSI